MKTLRISTVKAGVDCRIFGRFIVISACCLAAAVSATPPPLGTDAEWNTGIASHYGTNSTDDDSGSCGYGSLDGNRWPQSAVASIGLNNSLSGSGNSPMAGCGRCLELQCTDSQSQCKNSSTVVWITDSCKNCAPNQINLFYEEYQTNIGALTSGPYNIRWRQVLCPPNGPIIIAVDQLRTTLGGYMRFSLQSVYGSGELSGVQVRDSSRGSIWGNAKNKFGAAWELSKFKSPPFDMRVTSADTGEQLIILSAIPSVATGVFPTSQQFGQLQAISMPPAAEVPVMPPAPTQEVALPHVLLTPPSSEMASLSDGLKAAPAAESPAKRPAPTQGVAMPRVPSEPPSSENSSESDTLKSASAAEPAMEPLNVAFAPASEPAIYSPSVPVPSGEITSAPLVTHPLPPLSEPEYVPAPSGGVTSTPITVHLFPPVSEPEYGPTPTQVAPSAEPPTAEAAEPPLQASPSPAPQHPQPEVLLTPISEGLIFAPVVGPPPLSAAAAQPLNLTSYLFVTGANLLPLTATERAGIEHGISSALLPVHSNTSPQVTVTEMESPAAGRRKVLQIKTVDTVNLKVVVQTIVVDAPDIQLQLKGAVQSGLLVSAIRSQGLDLSGLGFIAEAGLSTPPPASSPPANEPIIHQKTLTNGSSTGSRDTSAKSDMGAIIGGIVGGIIVAVLLAGCLGAIFIFWRRKERRHTAVTQNELDAEWEVKSHAALHPNHRGSLSGRSGATAGARIAGVDGWSNSPSSVTALNYNPAGQDLSKSSSSLSELSTPWNISPGSQYIRVDPSKLQATSPAMVEYLRARSARRASQQNVQSCEAVSSRQSSGLQSEMGSNASTQGPRSTAGHYGSSLTSPSSSVSLYGSSGNPSRELISAAGHGGGHITSQSYRPQAIEGSDVRDEHNERI